jgi:hypothetical protein
VALVSACYSYTPVESAAVPPDTFVAVELTEAGTQELGRLLGNGIVRLEGDLVKESSDAFSLALKVARQADGIEVFWKGEVVDIPRHHVSRMYTRKLSKSRTSAVVAGFVGAILAVWTGLSGYGGSGGDSGQPPGSQ